MDNEQITEMDDSEATEMFFAQNPTAVRPDVLPATMDDSQASTLYEKEKYRQPLDFGNLPDEFTDQDASKYYRQSKIYGESKLGATTQTTSQAINQRYTGNIGNAIRPTKLPIKGRISQEYGVPVGYEASGKHGGIDIAVPTGTPIPEVAGGEVIESGNRGNWGNTIMIKGTDGIIRRYSHLSKLNYKVGQTVNADEVVGLSGNTGNSTGPHLDYREYSQ